jgi:hypothetical protein
MRIQTNCCLESLHCPIKDKATVVDIPDTVWDAHLSKTILQHGMAAYEESLLPLLLADLQKGFPPQVDSAGACTDFSGTAGV